MNYVISTIRMVSARPISVTCRPSRLLKQVRVAMAEQIASEAGCLGIAGLLGLRGVGEPSRLKGTAAKSDINKTVPRN